MINQPPDESCRSCAFWEGRLYSEGNEHARGECKRHSPLPVLVNGCNVAGRWPVTHQSQWCGDYQYDRRTHEGKKTT